MKKYICNFLLLIISLIYSKLCLACAICNSDLGKAVRAEILSNRFIQIIFIISTIFLIFLIVSFITSKYIANKLSTNMTTTDGYITKKHLTRFILGGILFGGSIIGFVDGILFHQILQLHNMISNILLPTTLINADVNMFWDGIFHAFVFIVLLISCWLIWHGEYSAKNKGASTLLSGSIFFGAGCFNLIEGLIDHQFMQYHHVVQQTNSWLKILGDSIFLLLALILLYAGIFLYKQQIKSYHN